MSLRQAKKLITKTGQSVDTESSPAASDDDNNSDEAKPNRFAALDDSDASESESSEEETEDNGDDPQSEVKEPPLKAAVVAKSQKLKTPDHTHDDADGDDDQISPNGEVEIESSSPKVGPQPRARRNDTCLKMTREDFDHSTELRRNIGDRQVRRRHHPTARGGAAAQRRMWLLPGESWPTTIQSGLVMEVKSNDGGEEFFLKQSQRYKSRREVYLAMLDTHDPNNLNMLLEENPFHVEARLQLAESLHNSGNHETSLVHVRFALHALQCGFHHRFSPFGKGEHNRPFVHIDSRTAENCPFFKAVWMYMNGMATRGCYRTAMEIAKLLLAADLEADQCHVLLRIDHFALRAECYEFVRSLDNEFLGDFKPFFDKGGDRDSTGTPATKHLHRVLPNFAYSEALSEFLSLQKAPAPGVVSSIIAEDVCVSANEEDSSIAIPGPTSDEGKASLRLMRAMLHYPTVLPSLTEAIGGEIKHSERNLGFQSTWEELIQTDVFNDDFLDDNEEDCDWRFDGPRVRLLSKCYAKLSSDVWMSNGAVAWLICCAHRLRELFETEEGKTLLTEERRVWIKSPSILRCKKLYDDVRVDEFQQNAPSLPLFLWERGGGNTYPRHFMQLNTQSVPME
eukprot:Selendium_serpulae@DN6467_c1_g1_i1.p1